MPPKPSDEEAFDSRVGKIAEKIKEAIDPDFRGNIFYARYDLEKNQHYPSKTETEAAYDIAKKHPIVSAVVISIVSIFVIAYFGFQSYIENKKLEFEICNSLFQNEQASILTPECRDIFFGDISDYGN